MQSVFCVSKCLLVLYFVCCSCYIIDLSEVLYIYISATQSKGERVVAQKQAGENIGIILLIALVTMATKKCIH